MVCMLTKQTVLLPMVTVAPVASNRTPWFFPLVTRNVAILDAAGLADALLPSVRE
jgi:hypothetical protein